MNNSNQSPNHCPDCFFYRRIDNLDVCRCGPVLASVLTNVEKKQLILKYVKDYRTIEQTTNMFPIKNINAECVGFMSLPSFFQKDEKKNISIRQDILFYLRKHNFSRATFRKSVYLLAILIFCFPWLDNSLCYI